MIAVKTPAGPAGSPGNLPRPDSAGASRSAPRSPSVRHIIDDYAIRPGDHCGSAAMRGLLRHYTDLDLPEPAVFGLGAGLATGYVSSPESPFACMVFGRQPELELDIRVELS